MKELGFGKSARKSTATVSGTRRVQAWIDGGEASVLRRLTEEHQGHIAANEVS